MDRVRLGRVLGRGARMAARTAMEAVEAASAPAPAERQGQASVQRSGAAAPPRQVLPPRSVQPLPRGQSSRPGSERALFLPMRKAARSVSLEVTGSFFALFALPFAAGAAHQWSHVHDGRQSALRFGLCCAVAAFFLYCAVSSFLRARRVS